MTYREAIAPGIGTRRTAARVTVDVTAGNITYSSYDDQSTQAAFSDVDQVANGVSDPDYRIATCEPDWWTLDGKTIFAPASAVEVGYISDLTCDDAGEFTSDPKVSLFSTADFAGQGLTLFFDRLGGSYPEEFTININYLGSTVQTISVTGNDTPYVLVDEFINPDYESVDEIEIVFDKMGQAYRRARLSEVYFGLKQQYGYSDTDPLISISTIAEADITGTSLPHGDAIVRLDNTDGDFNLILPSGIAQYLKSGAKMTVEIGVYTDADTITYETVGTYRFSEWRDAGDKLIDLTGLDTIGYYGPVQCYAGYEGWTTGTVAVATYVIDIFTSANVPGELYDDSPFPATSTHFLQGPAADTIEEELRLLAQWLCTVCICDEDGVIQFADIDTVVSDSVDLDDAYANPLIEQTEIIGGVDVSIYSAVEGASSEVVATVEESVSGSQWYYIWVGWTHGTLTESITGATASLSLGFSRGYWIVYVQATGTVKIEISGKPYAISKAYYKLDNPLASDYRSRRVTIDNHHIYTTSKAEEVANWTLNNYNKLIKLTYDWRGNPAIRPLDLVTAETPYGDKNVIVTRQDLRFDGILSGTIEGVG